MDCSDLFSERPRFESPLISGVQGFRVEECDHEDSPHFGESERGEIKECSRLLGGNFPQSSEGRRKFFSKKENLEKYYFEKHYSKLKVSDILYHRPQNGRLKCLHNILHHIYSC